jgi:ASC-1-like (ASCH) protein
MKALSLKQPWAELVLSGRKKIELRKWNTHFRGEFIIHASKVPDMNAMKRFGFENLPTGMIIGKAKLVDVKYYKSDEEFLKDKSLHLATSDWGNFGFLLADVERLENPLEARGSLNFWEFDETPINNLTR